MRKLTRRIFILSLIISPLAYFLLNRKKRWKYIVIHHSAGSSGNLKFLQKVHRERFKASDYMAYHFVVGNGKGMKSGAVEYGKRWKKQRWGAHVSWHNKHINYYGIGICLIGNFEKSKIKEKQYKSLVNLVKYLMNMYKIPKENVLFHGKIKGESTLCPGRYFPCESLKRDI